MTKRFCDLCQSPALDETRVESHHKFEEWQRSIPQGTEVCYIETAILFSFNQHKTGFGGPPDLCKSCRIQLIEEALRKVKE